VKSTIKQRRIDHIHCSKNLPFFLERELSPTQVGDCIYQYCKEVENL